MAQRGQYPVIFLTLKDIQNPSWTTWERMLSFIRLFLAQVYDRYRYIREKADINEVQARLFDHFVQVQSTEDELDLSFNNLMAMVQSYYGRKVILLIDEYDAPIQQAWESGYYTGCIGFMRQFLSSALKTNNTLEEFLNTLTQKLSLLQYVEDNGFHASDYLRKKAYILLSETDNKNSSGTTAHDRKERTPRERASRERKRIEVPNDILHPELYRKITEWRGTKAKETGMPAYVIIQQKALLGMVNLLPNDAESLEAVPYFGHKGVENYGLELLGIIRNYMKEQNLQRPEIRTVFVPRENKKNKEDTKKVSFRLFKEGMKVKEIAEFRELTTGTISNHLLHYVQTGDIKLQELVDQEKINYITAHLQKLPSLPQGVKEIKEKLGEYASYDEIRFVFEVYKKHIPT